MPTSDTSRTPDANRSRVRTAIFALAAVIFLLCTFRLGVFIGERKAAFSYLWGDNYHRVFAGPRHGFFNDFDDPGFTDAHGIFGSVIKIDGADLIVKDKDNVEKTIVTSSSTSIMRFHQTIPLSSVSSSNSVVIIGSPTDQGQIHATFIRVFPNGSFPMPMMRH